MAAIPEAWLLPCSVHRTCSAAVCITALVLCMLIPAFQYVLHGFRHQVLRIVLRV